MGQRPGSLWERRRTLCQKIWPSFIVASGFGAYHGCSHVGQQWPRGKNLSINNVPAESTGPPTRFCCVSLCIAIHVVHRRDFIPAYSSDSVYLFSTRDEPQGDEPAATTAIVPPNDEAQRTESSGGTAAGGTHTEIDTAIGEEHEGESEHDDEDEDSRMAWEDSEDSETDKSHGGESSCHSKVPIVHPRRRYAGACNVQTVKDGESRQSFIKRGRNDMTALSKFHWCQ